MKKMILALCVSALTTSMMTSCSKDEELTPAPVEEQQKEDEGPTGYTLDVHGYQPDGKTIVNGMFKEAQTLNSMVTFAKGTITYVYADGHEEVEEKPTYFNLAVENCCFVHVDSVAYAPDSMSCTGLGYFQLDENCPVGVGDTAKYDANVDIKLKKNGCPITARVTVPFAGMNITLDFTNDNRNMDTEGRRPIRRNVVAY